MESRFVYDDSLSNYELSEGHPFKPIRLELTKSLLEATGLLTDAHIVGVQPLEPALLASVHDIDYINAVKEVSRGHLPEGHLRYGLGTADNPIFPNMHRAIKQVCAATTTALTLVATGQATRAVNLAGGLHHAHVDKASGFCVYNDLATAIEHVSKSFGVRVAYIDIDAHHGDGVQGLFYERDDVLTFSIHESGRYLFPGTGHTYELGKNAGRGLKVNMPLEPFTEDASYMHCLKAILPHALEVFQPDIILLQAGADMHRRDPLADLALSLQGMAESYAFISDLADQFCEGRLVATGGGGYDPYHTVPRAWAALWAAVSQQTMPNTLPKDWRNTWQGRSPETLPNTLYDDVDAWPEIPRRAEIDKHNSAVVRRLLNTIKPIWQERRTKNDPSSAREIGH